MIFPFHELNRMNGRLKIQAVQIMELIKVKIFTCARISDLL